MLSLNLGGVCVGGGGRCGGQNWLIFKYIGIYEKNNVKNATLLLKSFADLLKLVFMFTVFHENIHYEFSTQT